MKVNGCPIELLEPEILRVKVFEPLLLLGPERFAGVDMRIRVRGGGYTSQIYAIRQAIAKGIVAYYQKCTWVYSERGGLCAGGGLVANGCQNGLRGDRRVDSREELVAEVWALMKLGGVHDGYSCAVTCGDSSWDCAAIHGRSVLWKAMRSVRGFWCLAYSDSPSFLPSLPLGSSVMHLSPIGIGCTHRCGRGHQEGDQGLVAQLRSQPAGSGPPPVRAEEVWWSRCPRALPEVVSLSCAGWGRRVPRPAQGDRGAGGESGRRLATGRALLF